VGLVLGVADALGVGVAEPPGVALAEALAEALADADAEAEAEADAAADADAEGDPVGETDAWLPSVGVAVDCGPRATGLVVGCGLAAKNRGGRLKVGTSSQKGACGSSAK
jgi:hypothetical protein